MSEIFSKLNKMFRLVASSEEGKKVLPFLEREFQFQGEGYEPFIVTFIPNKEISMEEGKKENPSFLQTTIIEISRQDLQNILASKTRPSQAYFGNKLKMSCMMSCVSYNYSLLHLLRIGQEQLIAEN